MHKHCAPRMTIQISSHSFPGILPKLTSETLMVPEPSRSMRLKIFRNASRLGISKQSSSIVLRWRILIWDSIYLFHRHYISFKISISINTMNPSMDTDTSKYLIPSIWCDYIWRDIFKYFQCLKKIYRCFFLGTSILKPTRPLKTNAWKMIRLLLKRSILLGDIPSYFFFFFFGGGGVTGKIHQHQSIKWKGIGLQWLILTMFKLPFISRLKGWQMINKKPLNYTKNMISSRKRSHISLPFPALLSRWFSGFPFWWDMWSFPGGCTKHDKTP